MSYQVLARKWRPKKFQDVIGQEHITRSLQNAILKDKIGHAYLFVGTRGIGKTSIARIFAKAIRCENRLSDGNACNECNACKDFDIDTSMNIIEIDGASNNSVDNIRDLISNVHYLPTSGKYKVYIIDEVHMLSTSAFNALLKTLEEPPAHVVFIFATTESHKLLGTVISRCQKYEFRNAKRIDLENYIQEISKIEKISFENNALVSKLAALGNGSFRDTLSLLDQVLTFTENNNITEKIFSSSLGIAGPAFIQEMTKAILDGNAKKVSADYATLINENISLKNIVSSILDQIYFEVQNNKNFSESELIWVYENLARETNWIFDSSLPDKTIEILLLKITKRRSFFGSAKLAHEKSETETPVENREPIVSLETTEEPITKRTEIVKNDEWDSFLNFLSDKSPASASNLEQGNLIRPIKKSGDGIYIDLGFSFSGLVFLDYLKDADVFKKLTMNLAEYFQTERDNIFLNLVEVKDEEEFVSRADLRQIEAENNELDQIEEFKNNPLLKEAEKIFNAKVDKVILETKK